MSGKKYHFHDLCIKLYNIYNLKNVTQHIFHKNCQNSIVYHKFLSNALFYETSSSYVDLVDSVLATSSGWLCLQQKQIIRIYALR